MEKDKKQLSVIDYTYSNGVVVYNHNEKALAYANNKAALYDVALQAENVSQALATLETAGKIDESIKAFKCAFIVKELSDNPKFWTNEKDIKRGEFIKHASTATGYGKEMLYKLLKTTEISSPENGRDIFRPEKDEKLTFSKLRFLADLFGNKDKSNKKDGESNLDINTLKEVILLKVQQYDSETGVLLKERYAIENSTSNTAIKALLTKKGYIQSKTDEKAATTPEKITDSEKVNDKEKAATTPENKPKKPLTIQALYNAVVALCNDNDSTITAIIKYHNSISK